MFVAMPTGVLAQRPHPILKDLAAIRQQDGVMVKWVIAGGYQCNGIRVFRAVDGGPFEQIKHIPGICGSTDSDETYIHVDREPVRNSRNSYRLEMGAQGYTETITVLYTDFGKSGHARLTDPLDGSVRLLFSNDTEQAVELEVLNMTGSPIHTDRGTSGEFTFSTNGWPHGMYVYRISGGSTGAVTGRMVVGR